MRAEIIAVGTELLIGHVLNSNAQYLSEELNALGVSVLYHTVVGDNPERIQDALVIASSRADLIITTGGLGPTSDDLTHESIAAYLKSELVIDEKQRKIIEAKFAGNNVPRINYKQAGVLDGASVIANPIGTAIGMLLELKAGAETSRGVFSQDLVLMSFPGVPIEMKAMFQETSVPYLCEALKVRGNEGVIVSRKVMMAGITESRMAQIIHDSGSKMFEKSNPSVAPYATLGECYLRITAQAKNDHAARNMIQIAQLEIDGLLGDYIFGYDEDTIPAVLARELRKRNLYIAFAESCTGGLLSKLMTDVPGASNYTKLNLVTYSNESKEQMLAVKSETLKQYGAVSEEVAVEMVRGLAAISGAQLNVSVTGIAGPDGSEHNKPIGTIHVAILMPDGSLHTENLYWSWSARILSREQVRELAAKKICYKIYKLLRL